MSDLEYWTFIFALLSAGFVLGVLFMSILFMSREPKDGIGN